MVRGGGLNNPDVAFMLDQCHNIEDKIPGQIRSVLNVQEMTARALLVDREALAAAQAGERRARRQRASSWTRSTPTCVRPSPSGASRADSPADPMAAYAASGYQQKIAADRVGGVQAGWGA